MSTTLTYDETVELLDRAVKEKGADYVYVNPVTGSRSRCDYFHGDEPGCIVGHVLSYKGFSARDTIDLGLEDEQGLADVTVNSLQPAENRVDRLLAIAQQLQDGGAEWGEAVKKAKQETA